MLEVPVGDTISLSEIGSTSMRLVKGIFVVARVVENRRVESGKLLCVVLAIGNGVVIIGSSQVVGSVVP